MHRLVPFLLALSIAVSPFAQAQNQDKDQSKDLPNSWVDKDTGHRLLRLTNEPGSSGFYFNVNAYTPDGKQMVYSAPDGIHVLDLATLKTRLLVPNPPRPADATPGTRTYFRNGVHAIVVGRKTNSVFFSKFDVATRLSTVSRLMV